MCHKCDYTIWDTKRRDTYLRKKRSARQNKVAGVILVCQGKVLLVRSYLYWGFPKGSLRPSETPFEGALREFNEEVGLDLSGLTEEAFQRWCPTRDSTFFVKTVNEIEKFKPNLCRIMSDSSNDASGVGWFNIGCVDDLVNSNAMVGNCYLKQFLKRINCLVRYKGTKVHKSQLQA